MPPILLILMTVMSFLSVLYSNINFFANLIVPYYRKCFGIFGVNRGESSNANLQWIPLLFKVLVLFQFINIRYIYNTIKYFMSPLSLCKVIDNFD